MVWDVAPPLAQLEAAVQDPGNPIGMRMRAAYFLKQAYTNDPSVQDRVLQCLAQGLLEKRNGSLMRHEYAYVMGQTQDERCCKVLETILLQDEDCSMVRHEAAEALAAIGAANSRQVLQDTMERTLLPEIYETCLLALNVMDWRERKRNNPQLEEDAPVGCACMLKKFSSIDPAPAHPAHATKTDQELGDLLCDSSLSMFDRYRAMFSLRDRGGEAAVLQLCRALETDTSSALLRHEVAYVLGQLQHTASVSALEANLRKPDEHQMVRHESAEALGAIEGAWDRVEAILQEFSQDDNPVVRESCLVALDAADYWGHNTAAKEEKDDEEDGKEEKEEPAPLSFVQQKNQQEDRKETQQLLNHRFNTQGQA